MKLLLAQIVVADDDYIQATGTTRAFIGDSDNIDAQLEEWCNDYASTHGLRPESVLHNVLDEDTARPWAPTIDGGIDSYHSSLEAAEEYALTSGVLDKECSSVGFRWIFPEDIVEAWMTSKGYEPKKP